MMMAGTHTASERLNARRAGSTTQAKRRVVIGYRMMIDHRAVINRRAATGYRAVIGYRAGTRSEEHFRSGRGIPKGPRGTRMGTGLS